MPVKNNEYTAAFIGQSVNTNDNCISKNEITIEDAIISFICGLFRLYDHKLSKFIKSEIKKVNAGVTKIICRNENAKLNKKNRTRSVKTNDTSLALLKRFIVLIPETAKIFWVKNKE